MKSMVSLRALMSAATFSILRPAPVAVPATQYMSHRNRDRPSRPCIDLHQPMEIVASVIHGLHLDPLVQAVRAAAVSVEE